LPVFAKNGVAGVVGAEAPGAAAALGVTFPGEVVLALGEPEAGFPAVFADHAPSSL
jgi:hypothetical protein